VPARRRRRSIAVFSASGGVGTTTIAVNVALTLAARFPDGAAIIDLAWPFGQVATHLDIAPRQTLGQLGRDEAALRDPALMRPYATRHDSGLAVFAAPGTWEPFGVLGADGTQLLIDTAMLAYEAVVVDAGSVSDERTFSALQRCDAVILPVRPEIAALRALHSLADSFAVNRVELDRAVFVVNHLFAREDLKSRDIEMALGRRPAVELPYDPVAYLKAVNEGVPVVRGTPASPAASALTRLAAIAIGDAAPDERPGAVPDAPPAAERRSSGLLGGIFGKRR
jgi:pilus assembly protein CpaE